MPAVRSYNAKFDSTLQFMQRRDWSGLVDFIKGNPHYARERGQSVAGLLYSFAWGVKNPRFANLNINQLGVLLLLNKSGARINRSYPLVSYVARFIPDKEDGGYITEFPDIERTSVTLVDQGDNLKEAEINARRSLALYVAICLETREDLVEPKYSIRNGLKTIKQRRVSVNLDDLVRAEAAP